MHPHHTEILHAIKKHSGKATKHTFLANYLGSDHPRYPISSPVLRKIAKEWASEHKELDAQAFAEVISSLVAGESFTEKCMGGILLDYAKPHQRKFNFRIVEKWLEHVEGWAEVDSLCTGKYSLLEVPTNIDAWAKFLAKLSGSRSVSKRRASLVIYTSPVSHCDVDALATAALDNIQRLKDEKDILITKAISWLLRSMIRHHRQRVEAFLDEHGSSLPAIAVRETRIKLRTGKKG
jgi:3-methyladenine DNA glycosylase AlkD